MSRHCSETVIAFCRGGPLYWPRWLGRRRLSTAPDLVAFWPILTVSAGGPYGRFGGESVAKLFLGVCAKFSRGAGALILKSCGGSHDQSDFQPAAFVSSLQGIGSRKTRFDGRDAKFCRHLIFEFCNTIPRQRPHHCIALSGATGQFETHALQQMSSSPPSACSRR